MKFKNDLEKRCFEVASDVLGSSVHLEHNQRLQIENALYPEVASFRGPPTKEVDVLVAEMAAAPKITLLVSCKELSKRAEPAHVQEWAAVVRTMNSYSNGTLYLGLVVSSQGFTSGCEAWATSHNLGLIPPLKGKNLAFPPEAVLTMFGRVMRALHKRVQLNTGDLADAPGFFDFVYSLISDFEGHEAVAQSGRYYFFPQRWVSDFSEMYSSLVGHTIEDLIVAGNGAAILRLSNDMSCMFTGSTVEFGVGVGKEEIAVDAPRCVKNLHREPCTLDFVKSVTAGLPITSGADFGDYIEFGINRRFNLGVHPWGFHIISTENPIDSNQL